MKRFFVIILIIGLLLAGCKQNNNPVASDSELQSSLTSGTQTITSATNESIHYVEILPEAEIKEEVVKAMRDMVLSDSTPYDLIQFIQNNIKECNPEEADKLFLILESVQNSWLEYYQSSVDFNAEYLPGTQIQPLKEFEKNGFRIITSGDTELLSINYGLYDSNKSLLSNWFAEYIEMVQAEANEPSVLCEKLNISYNELQRRILNTSNYIEKYPDSIRINEVINLYEDYIFSYFYGYDSEPVYDINTSMMSKDHFERYEEFSENNAGTMASKMVNEYIDLIEKGDYYLTEEIMTFLEDIFSDLNLKRIAVGNDIGRHIITERMGKLLPERTGFFWRCFGFAEYGHDATLKSILIQDGNLVYTVNGMVDKQFGSDISEELLSIDLKYRVEYNSLSQSKDAPFMMDSDFNDLVLISYPFIVGHKWTQYPTDDNGEIYSVESEIISITQYDEGTVYEVEYSDLYNGKNEKRLIQTGKGTIGFTKLYDNNENELFVIGYTIYEEKSGYLDGE